MEKIDGLLTKYVDELNSGKNPDISTFLEQCPTNDRNELKELIEMIKIYKNYHESIEVRPSSAKALFNKLENIRTEKHKTLPSNKYVANFRKNELTSEQKKKVQSTLDKLWDEEFREE